MIISSVPDAAKPIWTPDGAIVYASDVTGARNLWTVDGDGSRPRQLTSTKEANFAAAVSPDARSPDARQIAWTMKRNGKVNVWLADAAAGAIPRQLTRCENCTNPSFSPDGQSVFYLLRVAGKTTLYRIGSKGGRPQRVADSTGPAIPSPDGSRILCNYWAKIPGLPKLTLIRAADGAPLKTLDVLAYWDGYAWGDGDSIFFIPWRPGLRNIWEVTETGQQRQITKFSSESVLSFDYDRKRRNFVMARGDARQKLVLLRRTSGTQQ
jgi:hypothetical protein